MENSTTCDLLSSEDINQRFFQNAKDWYFGGYLKMDKEKAPDPVHVVTLLRVLGFRPSKKVPAETRSPLRKNQYRIEMNCDNPIMNVQMDFPCITSLNSNPTVPGGTSPVSHEIPVNKLKVAKEVFQMLMEFLLEQDGAIERKDNILEQRKWRRCSSLSMLGPTTPCLRLPLIKFDEKRNGELSHNISAIKIEVQPPDEGCSSKGLKSSNISNEVCALNAKLEEAMEVDVPAFNDSSLANNNVSPIGLVREKTWVLKTSKAEDKEFDKARTSTPTKPCITSKIGLSTAHGLSKILRPRQARTEVQPQRLRTANSETVRLMTQMRNAKELSSRTANRLNNSISSTSSTSSHSSTDVTRSNALQKTSSKLSVPSRSAMTASGGAKPKKTTRMGVSPQSSMSSDLSTPAGIIHSRRFTGLPQMRKESGMTYNTQVQKKEEQPPIVKPKANEPEQLGADGDKVAVKQRRSLLPRFNSTYKALPPSKGSKLAGNT